MRAANLDLETGRLRREATDAFAKAGIIVTPNGCEQWLKRRRIEAGVSLPPLWLGLFLNLLRRDPHDWTALPITSAAALLAIGLRGIAGPPSEMILSKRSISLSRIRHQAVGNIFVVPELTIPNSEIL